MKSIKPELISGLCVLLLAVAGVYAATPSDKTQDTAAGGATAKSAPRDSTSTHLPLEVRPHERIALIGGSLAERMNLFGNFEAMLHMRFPQDELVVRNFGWPCDAVDNRQRPNSYTALDDPLKVFAADTFLCFFGFNESFASVAGEELFRTA